MWLQKTEKALEKFQQHEQCEHQRLAQISTLNIVFHWEGFEDTYITYNVYT